MSKIQKSDWELETCENYLQNGFYCYNKKINKYLTVKGLESACFCGWFQNFQDFIRCFNKHSNETLVVIRKGELWTTKRTCEACGQVIINEETGNQNKCAA